MQYIGGSIKKIVGNENGIALVTALVLSFLGMLMIASLLTMVNTGTWLSGSKKRYHVALDAAHGGLDFFTREIIPTRLGGVSLTGVTYGGLFTLGTSDANLNTKLTTTGRMGDGIYPSSDPVDATVTFTFQTGPTVAVDTTIRSTGRGNSAMANTPLLVGGGVVNPNNAAAMLQHIPYLYQNATQAQNTTNPIENARLTSLYAF